MRSSESGCLETFALLLGVAAFAIAATLTLLLFSGHIVVRIDGHPHSFQIVDRCNVPVSWDELATKPKCK